jgi:hypothetical protein
MRGFGNQRFGRVAAAAAAALSRERVLHRVAAVATTRSPRTRLGPHARTFATLVTRLVSRFCLSHSPPVRTKVLTETLVAPPHRSLRQPRHAPDRVARVAYA